MRLVILIAWCALLASLEIVWPLRRYGNARFRGRVPNLVLSAIVVAMNIALSSVTAIICVKLGSDAVSAGRILIAIVALDLSAYIAHVLLHKTALGWRFHRVHHCEVEVDVTTALRQHPGETLWRFAWQLPAIVILRLPFEVVALYITISSLNALLEHANVRMPAKADAFLRTLFVTPDMHKVHHSRVQVETDSNYSNIFSVWDRLFRSYTRATDVTSLRYGLDGFDGRESQSTRGLLSLPLR